MLCIRLIGTGDHGHGLNYLFLSILITWTGTMAKRMREIDNIDGQCGAIEDWYKSAGETNYQKKTPIHWTLYERVLL